MAFNMDEFIPRLDEQLKLFDTAAAEKSCAELIQYLFSTADMVELKKAETIMKMLRRKRMFLPMQQVADALIQTGRINFAIRKLYAQALVDSGNFTGALAVLHWLIADTSVDQDPAAVYENTEAKGLIGRVYKQLYVNNPSNPQAAGHLNLSVKAYADVYNEDNSKLWHGINTAAMVERAKRDEVQIADMPDSEAIALNIIATIKGFEKVYYWDLATAAEACLVLNKPEEALGWLLQYARDPNCDSFELGSTLRQLTEVWQLDLSTLAGQLLLPILRSEFAKRNGGILTLDGKAVKEQEEKKESIEKEYDKRVGEQIGRDRNLALEKVFGNESFNSFRWYSKGVDRCLGVARIGKDAGSGLGTGFLVRGDSLNPALGNKKYLLTNAHVISEGKKFNAIDPTEAVVIFEALNPNEEFRDLTIVWTSPVGEFDATLLKFSDDDQERLNRLTEKVAPYPVSKNLPVRSEPPSQKIYIIGHPNGGSLQLSLYDNLLLDYEEHLVHYRTPTVGGSSGSPVFNEQWELIALHHAGGKEMQCLNKKPGTYSANEGIWIQSIIKAIIL